MGKTTGSLSAGGVGALASSGSSVPTEKTKMVTYLQATKDKQPLRREQCEMMSEEDIHCLATAQ
jgi:hypothetical protein